MTTSNLKLEFVMPHYGLSFPFQWNELYDQAFRQRLHSWAKDFFPWLKESPKEALIVCGHWIAFGFPHLTDPKLFALVCRLSMITSFWEDSNDNSDDENERSVEKTQFFSKLIWNIVYHPDDCTSLEMLDWKPYTFALYSIVLECEQIMPAGVWKHFQIYLTNYSNSLVEESSIAEGLSVYPSTELGVLNFRKANSWVTPYMQLVQLGVGSDIKQEERDETFNRLFEVATLILVEVSDYYSLRRELKDRGGDFEKCRNLIAVLAIKQGMGWQKAVTRLRDLLLELESEWFGLKKKILDGKPSSDMVKFIDGLEFLIGGNLVYHTGAKRLHGMTYKGCVPSAGRWIYHPDYTVVLPRDAKAADEFRKYDRLMDLDPEPV